MDPVLDVLSKNATRSIGKMDIGKDLAVNAGNPGANSRFFDLMTQKSNESLKEIVLNQVDFGAQGGPQSIPAADLELTLSDPALLEGKSVTTDKSSLVNLLADMNGDFNRMDRMVDSVVSGEGRYSYKDLISMQMFMGKTVVGVETTTRFFEQGAKGFNSLYTMQV